MFLIFLFLAGTIFGSFGSVLLRRLSDGVSRADIKSILFGRSWCPSCHRHLSRWQLIPLLGWVVQGGKCHYCRHRISSLYLVCEMVSGLIFVGRGMWMTTYDPMSILLLVIWWLLGLILIWDLYTYHLHMAMRMLLCVSVMLFVSLTDRGLLRGGFIGLLVFAGLYLFARFYVRVRFAHLPQDMQEGIGMGDVLLAPLIGILVAYHVVTPHDSLFFSALLDNTSLLSIVQLIIVYILGICVIGLLRYGVSRLFFASVGHKPDWSEGMGPVIPFLPSMIIMYWIIVFCL